MSTDPSSSGLAVDDKASVRKYLFDHSFDNELGLPLSARKPTKKIVYTAEQLEAEKKQAYEKGLSDGRKAFTDDQQKNMNALLAQIDRKMTELTANAAEYHQQQLEHAQEVALAIMRKILPAYLDTHGLDEIESIVTQVITERSHEPRLVVRVGEALFDPLSSKINALAEQKAYAGKVVVLSEESLGPSDCRIEWADGGIERDTAALWQTIERLMGIEHSTLDVPSSETSSEPADAESSSQPTAAPDSEGGTSNASSGEPQ